MWFKQLESVCHLHIIHRTKRSAPISKKYNNIRDIGHKTVKEMSKISPHLPRLTIHKSSEENRAKS